MSRSVLRAAAGAVAIIGIASLAACASTPSPGGSASPSGEPVVGGTLTFLEYQFPTCFYAGGGGYYPVATILNQIGDKLTYQDPETRDIEPWLAESWEINEDATEYIFHLRDDVTFSNGDPLTAEVVAANFDHFGLGDKELGLAAQEFVSNYESSEVIDDSTVVFHFTAPSPGFLQATSVVGSAIVAQETLELPYEQQCQLENFIGTGPFTVGDVVPEQEYTLNVRKDYDWAPAEIEHQGRAYLDAIHVIVTPEDSVRIGALKSGQGDAIRTVQAYDEGGLEDAGFEVYAPQTNGVNPQLALRFTNPLLADITVRKALQLATNPQEITDTLFSDNYKPATSVLSSGATGYVDLSDKLIYDPEKANELLDDAGWVAGADGIREKDGQRLSFTTFVIAVFPQSQQTNEIIAQQWEKVGVELKIETPDPATSTARQKDANDIGVITTHVGRVDPDVLKSNFWSKGSRNALLSDDTVLDDLLVQISTLPSEEERYAKAAEVQNYLIDNAYTIPLYELPQTYAAAPYVHGFGWESVGRAWLYNAWLDK
ncbi:ABC transporter substrate-binding protein [Microbacterium sp. Root61]|uniref:TIGR04028 family ABC transporter substrate-binding protein n=1 Tax=Microbacterium sp. Root61 TaxID=1736570 RepID=UPI0006FFE30A|nr:TIGR04028 family ABC transporter substrate-binding protein [Microbacterium sp. Root61]KRA23945.1 ABC transporter substrate-binding protein [Microbacterium sp. Root61]